MNAIIRRIEGAGISVKSVGLNARVEDDAAHEARLRDALTDVVDAPIIGGFSVGARIAAGICADANARALLGFGFPFHAAKDVLVLQGLRMLERVNLPTQIIQGARDPHGTEVEVLSYALPDCVRIDWLADGNHRFVPRMASGLTHEEHVVTASEIAIAFIRAQ